MEIIKKYIKLMLAEYEIHEERIALRGEAVKEFNKMGVESLKINGFPGVVIKGMYSSYLYSDRVKELKQQIAKIGEEERLAGIARKQSFEWIKIIKRESKQKDKKSYF